MELENNSKTRADSSIDGITAVEALKKGINDLIDLCDVVAEKFSEAREEHAQQMMA